MIKNTYETRTFDILKLTEASLKINSMKPYQGCLIDPKRIIHYTYQKRELELYAVWVRDITIVCKMSMIRSFPRARAIASHYNVTLYYKGLYTRADKIIDYSMINPAAPTFIHMP